MFVTLAAILLPLLVASVVPHRRRALARACLVWFLGLVPLVLLIYAIACWKGSSFGSYLALVPAILAVLCIIDARYGHSHRWARMGPRAPANAAPGAAPRQRASE